VRSTGFARQGAPGNGVPKKGSSTNSGSEDMVREVELFGRRFE